MKKPHGVSVGFVSQRPQRLVGDLDKNDTDATLWVLKNEPLLTP
jgi:hypothetical protein